MTKALSQVEITDFLKTNLKEWTLKNDTIKRDVKFNTFVEAFAFMTAIAMKAEKMDHHPNWSNSYNLVKIELTTHSENGLTQLDFDLAKKIDQAYKGYLQGTE